MIHLAGHGVESVARVLHATVAMAQSAEPTRPSRMLLSVFRIPSRLLPQLATSSIRLQSATHPSLSGPYHTPLHILAAGQGLSKDAQSKPQFTALADSNLPVLPALLLFRVSLPRAHAAEALSWVSTPSVGSSTAVSTSLSTLFTDLVAANRCA